MWTELLLTFLSLLIIGLVLFFVKSLVIRIISVVIVICLYLLYLYYRSPTSSPSIFPDAPFPHSNPHTFNASCDSNTLSSIGCSEMDNFFGKCRGVMEKDIELRDNFNGKHARCVYINNLGDNACDKTIEDLWTTYGTNKKGPECRSNFIHKKLIAKEACFQNSRIKDIDFFDTDKIC